MLRAERIVHRPFVIPQDLPGRLLPTDAPPEQAPDLRHAAVLALILPGSPGGATGLTPSDARHPDEPRLLLIERSGTLRSHAGQIAFPGGKVEATDIDVVHTALREAEEEIGLSRTLVEPLGFLDGYRTGTGFLVTPVVALVKPDFVLALDANEVASAFEVPLAFLMDEGNHKRHSRPWRGRERHYYAMPFGERYIWGATAGMLKNLHERLYGG